MENFNERRLRSARNYIRMSTLLLGLLSLGLVLIGFRLSELPANTWAVILSDRSAAAIAIYVGLSLLALFAIMGSQVREIVRTRAEVRTLIATS